MPEKPEVITVANSLKRKILNKKITSVKVLWDNIIAFPSKESFEEELIGEVIHDVRTRGKFLVFDLDKYYLLIHLRMEGKFTFREIGEEINKHEHVIFTLDNNIEMRYHDVRKFGKMYLALKTRVLLDTPLKDLGLEFDSDSLTPEYLLAKFKNNNKFIKTVLLDQSIITGIGNIYDDEILFYSRINPYRKASSLNIDDCINIIDNTRIILNKAIEKGGTTIRSFTSEEGVHGLFQNELLIHGKDKGVCPNCGTSIVKEKINGRGSYYCPKCQEKRR